jgi:hypothetical protein
MQDQHVEEQQQGSPVRVVTLQIPNHMLSEQLFGQGIQITRCQVIFRHMLPAPPEALLQAVMEHGLVMVFPEVDASGEEPTGLLVPWTQVSYIRFFH